MTLSYGMPPEALLKNKAVVKHVESGVNWWLLDSRWKQAMSEITACILNTNKIVPELMLKHSERRLVFKFSVKNTGHTFVVKAFPLTLLRHRLKQSKYAFSEAEHLLLAKARGLNVPEVFGYGFLKKWGLVSFNAVLIEYSDQPSLYDFLRLKNEEECLTILQQRVSPLFIQMYQEGVNHIDCDPSAILLSKSDPADDMLIDFQYTAFFQGRSLQTLAAHLGYFSWAVQRNKDKFISAEKLRSWFEHTINSAGGECDELLRSIYDENCKKPRSIKQRLVGYPLDQ